MITALVTVVPDTIPSAIRDGYGFWCVIRRPLDWDAFHKWSNENLPEYPIASEDCMGQSYTRMSRRYCLHGNDPRWFGFTTRAERDALVAAFEQIELPPTGADQLYGIR